MKVEKSKTWTSLKEDYILIWGTVEKGWVWESILLKFLSFGTVTHKKSLSKVFINIGGIFIWLLLEPFTVRNYINVVEWMFPPPISFWVILTGTSVWNTGETVDIYKQSLIFSSVTKTYFLAYTLSGIPSGEPPSCEAPWQPNIYLCSSLCFSFVFCFTLFFIPKERLDARGFDPSTLGAVRLWGKCSNVKMRSCLL